MKRHSLQNGSLKIEVLEWTGSDPSLTPIVFIPGMLASAEYYRHEVEANWQDRSCYSISLRGRGRSDAPDVGYRLSDQASDIEAVTREFGLLKGMILVAHSVGVAYSLEFAKSHANSLRSLVLLDHPPFHLPIEDSWVKQWSQNSSPEIPRPEILRAMQKEAEFQDLRGVLSALSCPILLVAGGKPDSMLTREDLVEFSQGLGSCTIHVEQGSGHALESLQLKKLLADNGALNL